MILSPGIEKQLPVGLDHIDGPAHIAIRHPALRDDRQANDIDPRFSITENMRMRRLMVSRINDETHSVLSKNRDHEQ
jgi:hypothetical protein